jgi:hypothetical protein
VKLWTLLLLGALALTAGAQDTKFTGELRVVLWNSLPRGGGNANNLILDLEAENGRWGRAYGLAQSYNNATHEGIVIKGTVAGDEFRLRVDLNIGDDSWVKGGYAGYDLVLKRDAQGNLTGTFDGQFKGLPATGKVTGAVKPPRPLLVKDYVPLDPDEHPRVLFRKQDIPALREKLNTPLGQAYFAKASAKTLNYYAKSTLAPWAWDPINCGVLYQLTGDTNWADHAKAVIERGLDNSDEYFSDFGAGSGNCGNRIIMAALTLDLCWDAWPAEFRKALTDRLREEMPNLLKHLYCTSYANTHPCSNYYGPGYGGPCITALVLWGMKGDEPVKPVDPLTRARPITPPADFTPGDGVPVVNFVAGKAPDKWLLGGPVLFPLSGDPLGQLGGSGRARPVAGVTAQSFMMEDGKPKTARLTFDPLAAKFMTTNGVDLVALAGNTNGPVTAALFAALKVDQEQVVGLARGQRETMVWLGGVELNEFEYYQLAPGVYPLVVTHATDAAAGVIAPFLAGADHAALKFRRQKHEMELALWRLNHDYWEQSGGRDAKLNHALHLSRQRMYQHYRLGVGDGGFQAETTQAYPEIATRLPLIYAMVYRQLFGRDASAYPDITHLLTRRIMQVVFRDAPDTLKRKGNAGGITYDGKWTLCQFVNSATGIEQTYMALFEAGYPLTPDAYKPAALWAWNKIRDVNPADPATHANVLQGGGLELFLSFRNYPLDGKAEPPGKVLPLTWQADTLGLNVFRNGWNSDDDFVGQVFLKAAPIKAHNFANAGAFTLLGLGHGWVNGPTGKHASLREFNPCVSLPLDDINPGSCGRLRYRQTWPDGSGTVTIDLDDIYASKGRNRYDANYLRHPDADTNVSPITGLRAVAFDYSGKSGAPCLFVLVDKITGGKERWWHWPLDGAALAATTTAGNTFTINYGDASLKATFITPADPKLDARSDEIITGEAKDGKPAVRTANNRIRASSQDHFFVVVTVQRKDAPVVKVEGAGLDAKVTVGNQTVRFDGEKIRLGK